MLFRLAILKLAGQYKRFLVTLEGFDRRIHAPAWCAYVPSFVDESARKVTCRGKRVEAGTGSDVLCRAFTESIQWLKQG